MGDKQNIRSSLGGVSGVDRGVPRESTSEEEDIHVRETDEVVPSAQLAVAVDIHRHEAECAEWSVVRCADGDGMVAAIERRVGVIRMNEADCIGMRWGSYLESIWFDVSVNLRGKEG